VLVVLIRRWMPRNPAEVWRRATRSRRSRVRHPDEGGGPGGAVAVRYCTVNTRAVRSFVESVGCIRKSDIAVSALAPHEARQDAITVNVSSGISPLLRIRCGSTPSCRDRRTGRGCSSETSYDARSSEPVEPSCGVGGCGCSPVSRRCRVWYTVKMAGRVHGRTEKG